MLPESHKDVSESPLGRRVEAPSAPDARVLYPVARAQARAEIGLNAETLPFTGADIWNAY
ncbi:MAG: NADPH-dependent 7-cyano-7-deazaguanine reductase QueF, partial [Rhodanobacteraceae bacterium]